jgi:hypothetical protein
MSHNYVTIVVPNRDRMDSKAKEGIIVPGNKYDDTLGAIATLDIDVTIYIGRISKHLYMIRLVCGKANATALSGTLQELGIFCELAEISDEELEAMSDEDYEELPDDTKH